MSFVSLLSLKDPMKFQNPQLYQSPMRSLKSKLAIIPKILNRQKFLKSCRLNFFILIQISITVNFSYVYVINYKITHWKKVVVFIPQLEQEGARKILRAGRGQIYILRMMLNIYSYFWPIDNKRATQVESKVHTMYIGGSRILVVRHWQKNRRVSEVRSF